MPVQPSKPLAVPTEKKDNFGGGAVFLLLLTLIIYLPALNGGFLWDDDVLLTDNPLVRQNDGFADIWFSTKSPDYFPLTLSMFWLEWRLWGETTTGSHVINLLLHGLGAVLLWRVLRRLKIPGSFVAATLFAVHPVCVASVAWIAERKNTLSLVFFLLSALCFFRFENESKAEGEKEKSTSHLTKAGWYLAALCLFLLALLSKTSVVMLPLILLGCAWWQRGRITKQDLLRTAPLFLFSLALGLVTVWFQTHRAIGGKVEEPMIRMLGGGWAAWFYLFKAFLPWNLSMIYPQWSIVPSSPMAWLPWLAWLGVFGLLWKNRQKWGRPLLFALGYFLITLLPVLGFFDMSFFTYARAADHLQYLSIIGVVALTGAALAGRRLSPNPWFIPAAVVLVMVCAGLSWQHAQNFASSERLWRHTLKKNPRAWVAHNNLGEAVATRDSLEEAIQLFQTAVNLKPDYAEAWNNLGNALSNTDRLDEAIDAFRKSLQARPDYGVAENNWGLALARRERIDEALPHFENAVKLAPDFPDAHYNLALTYAQQKKFEEAVKHYEAALKIRPDYSQVHLNLAMLLSDLDHLEKAALHFTEAVKLEPDFAEAHNGLGLLMVKKKDYVQAERSFQEAVRLDPENVTAMSNLGQALSKQNKFQEAIPHFQAALRLAPDHPDVHAKLGAALYELRQYEDALKHLEISLDRNPRNPTVHFQRGLILARMNRQLEAGLSFREALKLRPNYLEAREQLKLISQ